MNQYSRRRFLQLGSRTLAGAGLALGANPMMTLAQAADGAAGSASDYRALVCIFLSGGCDGFSLLVPTGNAEHAEYSRSRGHLALPHSDLIDLYSQSGSAPAMGLHRSAAALQPLFDQGRLALIANVGNLIEPTTKDEYENASVTLPAQLFSHADQEIQWQQLQGRDRAQTGWGALAADYLSAYQSRQDLTSVTVAGSNHWQSGLGKRPFALKPSGIVNYSGLTAEDPWQQPRADAFERVLGLSRQHVMTRAYADLQHRAMAITAELGQALHQVEQLFDAPPVENELADSLSMVAKLIASQETLGLRRQVFYVNMDGWDVHDNQSREQPELFRQLAEAMAWFQGAMDQIGQSQNVTAFTASDFGRMLTSNGDGTDHGWGNHLMAMGGAVRGGELYGTMPSLDVAGPDSVHHGRVLPTLSATQYAATLLHWIGLEDPELDEVLPNLANFTQRDLNFLG